MNIVALLAAGTGSRFGGDTPKQFIEINGKPLLAHSIEPFQNNPSIDQIMVVTSRDFFPLVEEIRKRWNFSKLTKIVEGGNERFLSAKNAVCACDNDNDNLLIHDAARPYVSQRIIDEVIEKLNTYNAVAVAVPATDTIYLTDEQGQIADVPARVRLMNAQTPQSFKVGTIRAAFDLAQRDYDFVPTDDISLIVHYLPQEPIAIVKGEACNSKITYADDLTGNR